MTLSGVGLEEPRVGGETTTPEGRVRPWRGREGEVIGGSSISTRKVSPSTVTWTGEWVSSPTSTSYQLSLTLIRRLVTANPGSLGFGKEAAPGARIRATD